MRPRKADIRKKHRELHGFLRHPRALSTRYGTTFVSAYSEPQGRRSVGDTGPPTYDGPPSVILRFPQYGVYGVQRAPYAHSPPCTDTGVPKRTRVAHRSRSRLLLEGPHHPDIFLVAVRRMPSFNDIRMKARAFVDAQNSRYATDHTANSAAYNCAYGARRPFAITCWSRRISHGSPCNASDRKGGPGKASTEGDNV